MIEKEHTCCFWGHRKIKVTNELTYQLREIIEGLIINNNIDTFLFGSKSEFTALFLKIVTKLKKNYSHIERVYARAEFPFIADDYKTYLLEKYDYTYYPEKIINAGRAVYIERNCEMIDNSAYCVIYYDESGVFYGHKKDEKNIYAEQTTSGTKFVYAYALKRGVKIINILKC